MTQLWGKEGSCHALRRLAQRALPAHAASSGWMRGREGHLPDYPFPEKDPPSVPHTLLDKGTRALSPGDSPVGHFILQSFHISANRVTFQKREGFSHELKVEDYIFCIS